MSHWYLVASLPHLRLGEKPPMSVEAFRAACAGHLSDEESSAVESALENSEPKAGGIQPSPKATADRRSAAQWWNAEVQLRDAVVRVRAKTRGIDASRLLKPHAGFSATIEKRVTDAFARPNPLEQEMELDRARWALADELALTEPFGFPGVLAFAITVRIAERWAGMDEEAGKTKVEELILSATTEQAEPGTEL